MTIYTLAELKKMKSVQFPEGNQITFWMDFANWRGVPSDRTFYITGDAPEQHKSFNLAADGYGAKENYGNGTIMVKKTDVLALAYQSNVDELVQELRETAGRLINGDVEDGAVSTAMLVAAAEGLERSSERTDDAVRAEKFAAQLVQLQKGIQDYLDGNYPNPRSYRGRGSASGKCPHDQYYYEECGRCDAEHFTRLLAVVGTSVKGAE